MGVKTTQLHGLEKQLRNISDNLETIDGFEKEDQNPLWKAQCAVENACEALWYAIKEAKDDSE